MSEKRLSHKAALLALLSDGRQHHMSECARAGGWRYGARVFELRKEGYEIETIRLGDDEFAHRLIVRDRQGVLI